MKVKVCLFGFALSLLFLGGCKSKESAYKAAYEAAKEKELQEQYSDDITTVEKTSGVQKEKITVIESTETGRYNVVIGSFLNKTNATGLKDRMTKAGYKAFLAQNESGMYRVIVFSSNDRVAAANLRDQLKDKYYPEFSDAWLLDRY
ncbi:MAG: SPOR domain-containing protein [Dysgonamonadaceae bacterium]|jgi:cell division septation protein DedD|nr:SPOR domain-containing protein [Dysgonamonadaceae bacterium]